MRNIFKSSFAILIGMSLVFSGCKKTETTVTPPADPGITVPEVSMGVINKVTGTLCPPCGGWGWTAFEELITNSKGQAYAIGTYSQNFVAKGLITPIASTWDSYWKITGYPTFCANFEPKLDRPSGSVNVTNEKKMCLDAVAAIHAVKPVVNTGFTVSWTKDGTFDVINVKSRTKFFKDASGDYNVGGFVIEDKAIYDQSGHTPSTNVEHHYVLRQAFGGFAWGELAASGTITAGKTIDKDYTMLLPAGYVKSNISVIFIIWKKNGAVYEFVNANSDQK